MSNLRNLKGKMLYKGMSITNDYPMSERQMIKEFAIKADEKNASEEENL